MKVVIAGGTGQVGNILIRFLLAAGHDGVVLTRNNRATPPARSESKVTLRHAPWDGVSLGPWVAELEGAGAIINLAGRSVNCRYHERNLRAMMESRTESTRVIGIALSQAQLPHRFGSRPPRLQSTRIVTIPPMMNTPESSVATSLPCLRSGKRAWTSQSPGKRRCSARPLQT